LKTPENEAPKTKQKSQNFRKMPGRSKNALKIWGFGGKLKNQFHEYKELALFPPK
jgi:hypothetical protein